MDLYRSRLALPFASLVLALAACSGETDPPADAADETETAANPGGPDDNRTTDLVANAPGADEESAKALRRIPADFRGTWATDRKACAARGPERFTVTGQAVKFFEGGGDATEIRRRGNALAVTFAEPALQDGAGNRAVYFALASGELRVREDGQDESVSYRRCSAAALRGETQGASASASASPSASRGTPSNGAAGARSAIVPARFRASYAPDQRACGEEYTYQPSFQAVDVTDRRVMFFENGGPVREVKVNGDAIAITYEDTYADQSSIQAIFLRLNDDGTVRYRAGRNEPVQSFVICK